MDDLFENRVFQYLRPAFLAAGYLESDIVFGYQNGAQLTGDYVVISLAQFNEDMNPEVRNKYADNVDILQEEHVYYRHLVTCSIDLFGNQAMHRARMVKSLLFTTDQKELAQKNFLGFVRYTPTQRVPYVVNNAYDGRAVFDLQMYYTVVEINSVGTIGQVTVIGDLDDGAYTINETIQEPDFISP